MRVYHNSGNPARPYPDYSTVVATVAAGTQTYTSGPLCDGLWVFGFRVYNGSYEEPNTSVLKTIRIVDQEIVSDPPPKPLLQVAVIDGGKVALRAFVLPDGADGVAAKVKFFTNNGAGGAVDYDTAIGVGFVNVAKVGPYLGAVLESPAYGETARVFGCIAYTSGGSPSLPSVEVTATPDATAPPAPLTPSADTGRV